MARIVQTRVTALVPQAPGLQLTEVTTTPQRVAVTLTATAPAATCPLCGHATCRIHSRYARTLADLPWAGATVRLTLQVRKFFCTTVVATFAVRLTSPAVLSFE